MIFDQTFQLRLETSLISRNKHKNYEILLLDIENRNFSPLGPISSYKVEFKPIEAKSLIFGLTFQLILETRLIAVIVHRNNIIPLSAL